MRHRVGIVGANLYGRIYAGAFDRQENADVVGLAFAPGDYQMELPAQLGLPSYQNLSALIDDAAPTVVCICSATADHAEHALAAAASGAHVLCDRPIATTLDDARRMIDAASQSGVKLMIGHVLRFWPEYVAVERLLRSGELGSVLSVTTSRVSGTLTPPWRQRLVDANLGLGAVEALIHDLDFLNWLLGAPEAMVGQGLKAETGAWGEMHTLLKYANGVQAQCESSYLVPLKYPLAMYLRVLATKGTVTFEFQGALSERGSGVRRLVLNRVGGSPEVIETPDEDAYSNEVAHFLTCIEQDEPIGLGTAKQGLEALAVALEVIRAASQGT